MDMTVNSVAKATLPSRISEKTGKPVTEAVLFDDEMPGFGLRIRADGHKSFIVQYKLGGKHWKMTIGAVGKVTLQDARRSAKEIFAQVTLGKNPAAQKKTAQAEAGNTLDGLVDKYLRAVSAKMRPRSLAATTYHLRKHWKPLHALPIASIDRKTISARLTAIDKDSGSVSANRARASLSALFRWAIGESEAASNPVTGTTKRDETARSRVLNDAELAAVWLACPETDYGRIVRLLMLTGQRREEIGALRWSEIPLLNAEAPVLTLPGARTKNKLPHDVPLSPAAVEILQAAPRHGERDLVFGAGAGGYSGWSRSKGDLDTKCGVTDWTLHDLRRTVATKMAEDLQIQPHVIEAALNHVSGHKAGVAGIYNRATYAKEKREAMNAWATHLAIIVAKATVQT